jgi:hypothetical protein
LPGGFRLASSLFFGLLFPSSSSGLHLLGIAGSHFLPLACFWLRSVPRADLWVGLRVAVAGLVVPFVMVQELLVDGP